MKRRQLFGALASLPFLRSLKLKERPTVTIATKGPKVVTCAATFYIKGPPVRGDNALISNAYAIWVDDGHPHRLA